MKKSFLLLILLAVLGVSFFVFQSIKEKIRDDFTRQLPSVVSTKPRIIPNRTAVATSESIFVPYWVLSGSQLDLESFDQVIYFGVAANKDGIDEDDEGFRQLESFTQSASSTEKLLTLRMLERDATLAILKDKVVQEKLIAQTFDLVEEHDFSGVVLDLELTALPFDSLVKQISDFTIHFSEEAKSRDVQFAMTVYGDTFYRVRPFDIASLSKHVDSFLIMSYDFHKSGGNPGPNFPLGGKATYGYDFETMLGHFLAYVPPERLGIIYGMYGYDWMVNDEGKATGQGVSMSLLEINNTIVKRCDVLACTIRRDTASSETNIRYKDEDDQMHIVWYEDEVSVEKKEAVARRFGIGTFSFWAYSFF